MSELLGGIAIGDVGLSGLVIMFVILIYSGKLVPKSTLDNERANTQTYREMAQNEQAINTKNSQALTELLALGHTTNHALTEIQAAGQQVMARPREAQDS